MIDVIDIELRQRFAALVDPADDSDWSELRVPRRRLRTSLAITASLALTMAVAASAAGLPHRIVSVFGHAKPAPPPVSRSFTEFDQIVGTDLAAPPREVISTPAATWWVAPTRTGGFCSLVRLESGVGAGGECGPRYPGLEVDVSLLQQLGGPVLLRGTAGQRDADSLRLAFEDGTTAAIPLVRVSEPVATAFFLYALPREHRRPGRRPTTLTLLSAGGHELAHREITGIR
jgi:hypothetical protein